LIRPVYDVIIVGYGPTGATLANLLGLYDLKVLVLEREEHTYRLPRAVHFDEEVMRVFQTIGLAHLVAKVARVNPGMKFVDDRGELLLDWPRPPGIGCSGWHSSYRFHQPDLERVLRDGVQRFATVTVRSQSELTDYIEDGEVVQAFFNDLQSGRKDSARARFLVGCDGGRSSVRSLMRSSSEDLGFRESWLVVDVLLNQPMEQLGDYTIQYCNSKQPATYVRCPENRRRWELAVPPSLTADEMCRPEYVWQQLEDWIDPSQAMLERAAVYTFHSTIAKRWRFGRTFIAGDAAHQMPPFMGQGMCAGIRDVANLGWKLYSCVSQGFNDPLLDSYQSERQPHVRAYIETAIRLGVLLSSCETGDDLRLAMSDDDGRPTMKSITPRLGPGAIADLSYSDANGQSSHLAGTLAPQPMLETGMLDDVVGYNPVLLIDDALLEAAGLKGPASDAVDMVSADTQSTRVANTSGAFDARVLENLQVQTANGSAAVASLLTTLKTTAVLIRADRYIFGTADTIEQLEQMLEAAKLWRMM